MYLNRKYYRDLLTQNYYYPMASSKTTKILGKWFLNHTADK